MSELVILLGAFMFASGILGALCLIAASFRWERLADHLFILAIVVYVIFVTGFLGGLVALFFQMIGD